MFCPSSLDDANDHGPKIQNRSTAILRQLSNSGLNSDNSSHSVVFPSDNSARLQMSGMHQTLVILILN